MNHIYIWAIRSINIMFTFQLFRKGIVKNKYQGCDQHKKLHMRTDVHQDIPIDQGSLPIPLAGIFNLNLSEGVFQLKEFFN